MNRLCMSLVLVLVLGACPDDDRAPDGSPRFELGGPGSEAGVPDQGSPGDLKKPADQGQASDADAWQPSDLGFSCGSCLLEQVCVHSVNSTTCQVIKSQCKYRTPACFSPKTNPCCDCEAQVCGLWSTCTRPAACAAPPAGSYDPDRECFCYSK